ncbi:uncharacterized protein LOC144810470 isoform X1 [Lissotriton helveticus]
MQQPLQQMQQPLQQMQQPLQQMQQPLQQMQQPLQLVQQPRQQMQQPRQQMQQPRQQMQQPRQQMQQPRQQMQQPRQQMQQPRQQMQQPRQLMQQMQQPRQAAQHLQQAAQHLQQLPRNHQQAVQQYHQPVQQQQQQQATLRRLLQSRQHQQPKQTQQSLPLQQVLQFEDPLNLQRPIQQQEPVGYINENVRQQQLLLMDRGDELYAVDHLPHNPSPGHISPASNVAALTYESLGHLHKPSYDSDKNDSHTSNQTQTDTFQHGFQDVQNTSNTRTSECEQSSKALDNIQFQKPYSVCSPSRMKENANGHVGLLVNPSSDSTVAKEEISKDLIAIYLEILATKKRLLHLGRLFKSKAYIYDSLKSKASTTVPSSSAHEISVPHKDLDMFSVNRTTVSDMDSNFASSPPIKPDGPLYRENQLLVKTNERNYRHPQDLINNEGLCRIENNQVSKHSPVLSSPSQKQHNNRTLQSPTQPINSPGGHYFPSRKNEPTVVETHQTPEENKWLTVFEQVTGSAPSQELVNTCKIITTQAQVDNIGPTGQQSPCAFELQSNLQPGTKVDHSKRSPLLHDLLVTEILNDHCSATDNDSCQNLKNAEVTSSVLNHTESCSNALASNSVTKIGASNLEESKLISAEIESPLYQLSSATMEALESCFNLWKTPPCNSTSQNKQAACSGVEPQESLSSAGLCDQKCTTSQEIVQQTGQISEPIKASCGSNEASHCPVSTAVGQKQDALGSNVAKTIERVAVVNPLVLSKSGSLIEIHASESQKVELCPAVHETTLPCLIEQNSTQGDALSLPELGSIAQPPSGNHPTDERDSDASMNHKNDDIITEATRSSCLSIKECKIEILEKTGASESGNIICQLGSNPISQTVHVGDCSDTLLGADDEQLLISSICTLVEGSTLYDSKIAKIFDASCSKEVGCTTLKVESDILHPVIQLQSGTSTSADETEVLKLADVQSSNSLKPDFANSHDKTTYCTDDIHVSEAYNSKGSPSKPVRNQNVSNSKYNHGSKQHSEDLEIIAASEATEVDCVCSPAPRERERGCVARKENCFDKYAPLADGKINESKHSVKAVSSHSDCDLNPDEEKDSEEQVSLKADEINKNSKNASAKDNDNDSDSSKEKDDEKCASIAEEQISKDHPFTPTPQFENQNSAICEEISHKRCTSVTAKRENERESADELLSAQGLDNQLSELLIEFPFGLDRMENKHHLEGKGVIKNEELIKVISTVKEELQLDKACRITSETGGSKKVSSIGKVSEDRNIKHEKSIDNNLTASVEVPGLEKEKSVYQSLMKLSTTEKKSRFPLDVNSHDSPSLICKHEADCQKEGLKNNVITEKVELKCHICIKQEPQFNEEGRMCLEMCGLKKEDSNICQETNVLTVQKSVDQNDTISPESENKNSVNQILKKCDPVMEQSKLLHTNNNSSSLNITDAKIPSLTPSSIKMEITMTETQVYSCVKQEFQFDRGCKLSSRGNSFKKDPACRGAEKSDVTHPKMVEKNILLSLKEIIGSEKENPTNQSLKQSNTAEQKSTLLLVENCSKMSGSLIECPGKNESTDTLKVSNYANSAPLCYKESELCAGVPCTKEVSSGCQELEGKSTVEKIDSKFDKKVSSSDYFISGKENSLDKGLEQHTFVTPQESLLNELADMSDSEIDNTSSEIKITLLDSENMTKLFPQVQAMSAGDVGTRDPQLTEQDSAGPKVNGLSHSTEIRCLKGSVDGDMKITSPGKSPCCLYSWIYSLYAYGPKCMCRNADGKGNTKSDLNTESSRDNYVNTNKAGFCAPTVNSDLSELLDCSETSNEANTLSVEKKGIKRPHSPTVNDVKRIRTVDDLSPVEAQPTLVENKPSPISDAQNVDIYKKKSKPEHLIKSKKENKKMKSRIKHQHMDIAPMTPLKMASKLKYNISQKDQTKTVLPVPNCTVQKDHLSCNKNILDSKTYKEICKEKKEQKRHALKSQFTISHGSSSPRKNLKDKVKCMRLNTIDANGLKPHGKFGKVTHEDKEKKCKLLPGNSSLRKEEQSTSNDHSSPRKEGKLSTSKYDKKSKVSSPRKDERLSVRDDDKMSKPLPTNPLRKEGKSSVYNDNKKSKVSLGSSSPSNAEKSPTYDYEKKSKVSPGNSSPSKEKKSPVDDKKIKTSPRHSPTRKEQCFANDDDKKCKASPGNAFGKEQCSNCDNDKKSKASSGNSPPRKKEQSSTNSNDMTSKASPGNYSPGCEAKSPGNNCEKKSKVSLGNSPPSVGEISHKNKENGEKSNASPANSSKKEEKYFTNNDTKSKSSSGKSPFSKEAKSADVYERKSKTFHSNYSRDDANSPCSQERTIKASSTGEETSTNIDDDKKRRSSSVGAFPRKSEVCPTADYEKKSKASSPVDEAKYINTGTNKSNEKRVSNLEKKLIEKYSEVEKVSGRMEPGLKCVRSDKKEFKFKSHDASTAKERKKALTIEEYRARKIADRNKAVKKTMAGREAIHQNKLKLLGHSHSPVKTGILKERFTQSNGSHPQDKKSSKTTISNGTAHESLKGSHSDPVQLKSCILSNKDEGTKNGFLHTALPHKHMNIGKSVTNSGTKGFCVVNEGGASSKPLGCPATAVTKSATQESICTSKLNLGKSSGPEKFKRAFSLTMEKKDTVTHLQNSTLGPKMLKFKMCPEGMFRRHSVDGGSMDGNGLVSSEKSPVEVIKSKKEDWYNNPTKKKKVEINGDLPESVTSNSSTFTPEKTTIPVPAIGSNATFNAFKQRYLKERSKSVDIGLPK